LADVFISYDSEDRDFAQKIARGLSNAGFSVWWDRDILAGVKFNPEIQRQIEVARAVIVLWSKTSVRDSDWVHDEAQFARDANKLIPVRLDGTLPPLGFRQVQSLDMQGWNGDPGAGTFAALLASLHSFLGDGSVREPIEMAVPQRVYRQNSICVLPFVTMSDDAEQEYFSDGITEDIITDLSKVSALFVIARNTAFTFKGKTSDVSGVARQLGVRYVLQGSVRKSHHRLRITAQLVDGATNGHVWAERYDRELIDVFQLQDEISMAIVSAMKAKLLPDEKSGIERRGTNNLDAYDLYVRGKRPAFSLEQEDANIALLEAAIRLAPDYADAWGEVAKQRALSRLDRPYSERNQIAEAATAEAEKALGLDPMNVSAMEAQYELLPPFGRFIDAEAIIQRMVKVAPRDANVNRVHAKHLQLVGRNREALEAALQAYRVDPLDPLVWNVYGRMLWQCGRYAEARLCFEALLTRLPEQYFAAVNIVLICIHTRDWAAIDALLASGRLAWDQLGEFSRSLPRYVAIRRDPSPSSRGQLVEAARRRFFQNGTADLGLLQDAAEMGAMDEAYSIALQGRFGPTGSDRDRLGYDAYRPVMLFNAMYPALRRDPRFVKLCARLGLVEYWLATGRWPDCVDEVAPYYEFKSECARVVSEPSLPPASELATPTVG